MYHKLLDQNIKNGIKLYISLLNSFQKVNIFKAHLLLSLARPVKRLNSSALLGSPEAVGHEWAQPGGTAQDQAGEPAHSAEHNAETQQRRKMSLAKTLALNKRGKRMETCSPAGQAGAQRGRGSAEGWLQGRDQAWARTRTEES